MMFNTENGKILEAVVRVISVNMMNLDIAFATYAAHRLITEQDFVRNFLRNWFFACHDVFRSNLSPTAVLNGHVNIGQRKEPMTRVFYLFESSSGKSILGTRGTQESNPVGNIKGGQFGSLGEKKGRILLYGRGVGPESGF